MINELRIRNELLLSKCVDKKDMVYLKQAVIKRLLCDDMCFFKMKFEDAYNILCDLGYKETEALNIYKKLISPKAYEKLKVS